MKRLLEIYFIRPRFYRWKALYAKNAYRLSSNHTVRQMYMFAHIILRDSMVKQALRELNKRQ